MIHVSLVGWLLCSTFATLNSDASIAWNHGSLEDMLRHAKQEQKPLMLYFWTEGSESCVEMFQGPLQHPRVVVAAAPYLWYSIGRQDESVSDLFEKYRVPTVPSLRVVTALGRAIDGLDGVANVPTVVHHLERIARREDTLEFFLAECEKDPGNLDRRQQLAHKHAALGDTMEHDRILQTIRDDDPEGKTSAAARLHLTDAFQSMYVPAQSLDDLDQKALSRHIENIGPDEVRQEAWDRMAELENARGDRGAEIKAYRQAFPLVADGRLFNWGWNKALWLWSNRDVLSRSEKQFALEIARKTAAVSERLSQEDPGYYDPAIFLTRRLNVLGMCLNMNGKRKEAIAQLERCVELSPQSGEYRARLDAYREGREDRNFAGYSDYRGSWSPDGRSVVFTSNRDGNAELYLADWKRRSLTRITRSLAEEDFATFHPKGKTIAYVSNRFKTGRIYESTPTGKRPKMVFAIENPEAPASLSTPAYSTDGNHLACLKTDGATPRLAFAAIKNRSLRWMEEIASEGDDCPTWFGEQLVFASTRGGTSDIYRYDLNTQETWNLTAEPVQSWDLNPHWSADGTRIVFASWRSGTCDLYLMASDGSDVRRLTEGPEEDHRPRFSPDGQKILFDRKDESGQTRLWLMNADGSEPQPLPLSNV